MVQRVQEIRVLSIFFSILTPVPRQYRAVGRIEKGLPIVLIVQSQR